MGIGENNRTAQMPFAQHQPDQPPAGQRRQGKQTSGKQRMVRILVTGFGHGGDEIFAGVLLNAHTHFFAERNVLIPGLLQLPAPVAAMQNIVQRGDRFNHQEVADRRGGWRGNLALVNKTELGKKIHRVFASATGHALNALLTGDGLQRHRHQRTQAFILHRRVYGHKTNGGFVLRIDI